MMRSSPAYFSSRPPLRKYVTCAYFSVSAMRSCVRPARETISPRMFDSVCGGKSACRNAFSFSLYSVMPTAAATFTMRER